MPIEELGLSVRAYNALKRNSITKVGELLALNDDELLHIRNFGDKSLVELRDRLATLGLLTSPEEEQGTPLAGQASEQAAPRQEEETEGDQVQP